jgi:hypothetical protein
MLNMSASNLINSATGKIYDQYIPQGGGVNLSRGQLISAVADGTEVAVPTGANGTFLQADSDPLQLDGLRWVAIPGVTPLAQGQLLSADLAGDATIVTAPNLPAQANWVLTADGTAGAGGTNMLWKPVTGGGGIINANLPLFDDATQTPNKIGINFSASVGEIPYGNGTAQVGALTNTPVAGQILGVNAGVPAWINAGGSATVTANLPLIEGIGSGNSSLVSINFAQNKYGEIPYGTGATSIGALLAPPTDPGAVGKVLTYAGTPSILEWRTPATPVGGDIITLHSSVASTPVPVPQGKDEQLILVAEQIGPAWNLTISTPIPNINLPPPFDKAYQPELRFKTSGGQEFIAVEYLGGSGREVAIYTSGLTPNYLVVTLKFQTTTPNESNAFVSCACNGIDAYGVNHWAGNFYDNKVVVGGRFNSSTDPMFPTLPELAYNVLLITQNLGTGVWEPSFVGITDLGNDYWNGPVNNNDPNNIYGAVWCLTPFSAGALAGLPAGGGGAVALPAPGFFMGGTFTDLIGFDNVDPSYATKTGFFNIIPMLFQGGEQYNANPMLPAQTVLNGFAIGATQIQATADGSVTGILFDSAYTYMWLIGNQFAFAKQNGGAGYDIVPPNCQGFVLFYPVGLNPGDSAWGQLGAISPPFGTDFCYDIKPSVALADRIIVTGDQLFLKDITVPTAGVASYTAVGSFIAPIAVGFPLTRGYINSISTNSTITTPTGSVTGDFLVVTDQLTPPVKQYVGYFTTATGTVLQPLAPIPCGPNTVAIGSVQPSYGINKLITPTTLTIGGDLGEYFYDADLHANIEFTCGAGVNFKVPAGTPSIVTARFTQPYQSQSYIASSDLASWIQIGAINPNLTYA